MWNLVPGPKSGKAADMWVIVDHVRAPAEEGEYVLRWRESSPAPAQRLSALM